MLLTAKTRTSHRMVVELSRRNWMFSSSQLWKVSKLGVLRHVCVNPERDLDPSGAKVDVTADLW